MGTHVLHTHMKRFFGPVQIKTKRSKNKLAVQKQTRAVSEAGERAVRDGLFGATGPESVLSVVEASRPKNGAKNH